MQWHLRRARSDDADRLTEIAMDAKASWGYSAEFMESCRPELTITARRIEDETMIVAESPLGELLGFVSVVVDDEAADLADLFVVSAAQSAGVGRALWDAGCDAARLAGSVRLTIEADPNAVGWYERRGAVRVGEAPSGSIPGRMLPLLELTL